MALYRYRAMDTRGHIVRGNMDAINPMDLEMRLHRITLDLISHSAARRSRRLFGGTLVKRPELITFCFHLEQLLRAGVQMVDALRDLRDSSGDVPLRDVIANLIETIEGGSRLSDALATHADVFDAVFVNLIRAGEESGELPEVLRQLTENLKWQDEMLAQTRKLLLYPAVTGVVVVGMMFFLMIYVVPKLVLVIRTLTPELSTSTRMLIAVSDVFVADWPLLLMAPVLLGLGIKLWMRSSEKMRVRWDAIQLKIPRLGDVLTKVILARFSTYFALMYRAGIPILDCIRICERIAGNRVIQDGLERAGRAIGEGKSLSAAFQSVGLFPPLVLRMLSVGETTGALETSLDNVSYFYNRDIRQSIESVQQILQPLMILVFGSIIILILLPVFGPIYDAISKVQT